MKSDVSYKPIERPIDYIILQLTAQEAKLLQLLTGGMILGNGSLRDLSSNIYSELTGHIGALEDEYITYMKEEMKLIYLKAT